MTTALNPRKLSFSTNWNGKLDCTYFTTLRLSSFNVGDALEIWHKSLYKGEGRVVDKKIINLNQISDWIGYLDTGYNAHETKKILMTMHHTVTDWDKQLIYYYLIEKTARI